MAYKYLVIPMFVGFLAAIVIGCVDQYRKISCVEKNVIDRTPFETISSLCDVPDASYYITHKAAQTFSR